MFPYDLNFLPPAPALDIEIRNPQTGATQIRLAKIDTGADGTVIPKDIVEGLGLLDFDQLLSVGFDGSLQVQTSYMIDILLPGKIFTDIEVITAPLPYVLIGRDLLNQLVMTFDGPQRLLSIQ